MNSRSGKNADQSRAFRIGAQVTRLMGSPQSTLDEVAAELGISWQRVWQIERVAMGKLVLGLRRLGWSDPASS